MALKQQYGKWVLRPADREPGTLRQQLEAINDFIDLQNDNPVIGYQRERRWEVIHALRCGRDVPPRRHR